MHSVVLFSASSYFKMLMDEGLLKEQRFCLQNSNLESLQILVNFMYTGCLILSENNILITLALATQLDVPEAVELCQQFLQDIARRTHTRALDSVASTLKPRVDPSLAVAIKQELDELKVDECEDCGMSALWDNDCRMDYKVKSLRRKCRKHKADSNRLSVRNLPCKRENSNNAIIWRPEKEKIPTQIDRKKHYSKTRKDMSSLQVTNEEKLCHNCVVCNKIFKWYSVKALHQVGHWSVLYGKLVVNHLITLSKWNSSTQIGCQMCAICHQIFRSMSVYRTHLLTLHRTYLYKYLCGRCPDKRFQYRKHLRMHYFIHHRTTYNRKSVTCPICHRHFLYERSMLLHKCAAHPTASSFSDLKSSRRQSKRNHQSSTENNMSHAKWKCEEKNCTCAFSSKNKLYEHMTRIHPQVNYTCPMSRCKFSTVIKLMLDRHCKKYHDASCSNICDVCGKIFQRAFRLKIHMFSRHRIRDPDLTVYNCPVEGCHYSTVLKDGVKKHMIRHQSEKPFTCEMCGKHFKLEKSVSKHIDKVHLGIRNYICDICGVSYGEESELKIHMVRHSDKKTYTCEHCHYATFDKGNYKTHLYGKHGIKLEEHMKIFECNICQFTTNIKYQYSDHMRVHYQIRDIPCPHCNKKFITRKSMRSHIVKCHKPKDYHCSVCSYSSAVKSKVHEHMRVIHTHKHYKPYQCPYCSFQCATGGNCRKHVKQRHKGQEVKYIKLPLVDPLSNIMNPEYHDRVQNGDMQSGRIASYPRTSANENRYDMPELIAIQPHTEMIEFAGVHQPSMVPPSDPPPVLPLSIHQALGGDILEAATYEFVT